MLEFFLCSVLTILPDWLYRRYRQGKRWGHEITFYSVWYELRWGITTCLILTVSLITVIFYYHPSTTNVTSIFRTVTILSEGGGRVSEVHVVNDQKIKEGDPIFSLDGRSQEAAAATAAAKILEIDALIAVAQSELTGSQANVEQAEAALKQSMDELARKATLTAQGSAAVSAREVERLENVVDEREAGLHAAQAGKDAVADRIRVQYPAQRASAEAALDQAEAELSKLTIYAGTDGQVKQFALQVGDYINPILRPAGILVPEDVYQHEFQAGFHQLTAQVVHVGMLAEITCLTNPMKIMPMVVTRVQNVIPAGQFRPSDRLMDVGDFIRPGTIAVVLQPLYPGTADHVPPGSNCIANAYTNNHDRLDDPDLSSAQWLVLHAIDAVGIAHAAILRLQALLLPVQTLVFSGH